MVDRFEDPETMLKQAIREMESSLEAATAATARAIAGERLLAKEQAEHSRRAKQWRERAEEAVARQDDDLARCCLARKREHETLERALADQWTSAQTANVGLRRQVDAMRAKLSEARRKLATLTAHRRAAEARRGLAGVACPQSNGFARYERLRPRVDLAEAEAEAFVGLSDEAATELESECARREADAEIEAELASIKSTGRGG
jgi:phage shock protein A